MQITGPSGRAAAVTTDGQLHTLAARTSREHQRSLDGQAFVASTVQAGNATLTTTANRGTMLYVANNDPTLSLVVSALVLAAENGDALVTIVRNPIQGALTNNSPIQPLNCNFGRTNQAAVTAHVWDEVGDGIGGLTGGEDLMGLTTNSNTLLVPGDAFVLPPGSSIALDHSGLITELAFSLALYMDHPDLFKVTL